MWKKVLGLVVALLVLLQLINIFAAQKPVERSTVLQKRDINIEDDTAQAGNVNYSYCLEISGTEATVMSCVIGNWETEKIITILELQKAEDGNWVSCFQWMDSVRDMRMTMWEQCKVSTGTYRVLVTFILIGTKEEEFCCVSGEVATGMDFSLDTEMAQCAEILEKFMSDSGSGDIIFDNPQEIAEPYIPQGSQCTEVCILGDVLYIDYRLYNIRYIIGYYKDGRIEKTVRESGGNTIYTIWSDKEEIESMDIDILTK